MYCGTELYLTRYAYYNFYILCMVLYMQQRSATKYTASHIIIVGDSGETSSRYRIDSYTATLGRTRRLQ
jgi:hypothetical protein